MHCVVELTRTPDLDRNWKVILQLLDDWYIEYPIYPHIIPFSNKNHVEYNRISWTLNYENQQKAGVIKKQQIQTSQLNRISDMSTCLISINSKSHVKKGKKPSETFHISVSGQPAAPASWQLPLRSQVAKEAKAEWNIHRAGKINAKVRELSLLMTWSEHYRVTMWIGHCHCFCLKSVKKNVESFNQTIPKTSWCFTSRKIGISYPIYCWCSSTPSANGWCSARLDTSLALQCQK